MLFDNTHIQYFSVSWYWLWLFLFVKTVCKIQVMLLLLLLNTSNVLTRMGALCLLKTYVKCIICVIILMLLLFCIMLYKAFFVCLLPLAVKVNVVIILILTKAIQTLLSWNQFSSFSVDFSPTFDSWRWTLWTWAELKLSSPSIDPPPTAVFVWISAPVETAVKAIWQMCVRNP